MSDTSTLIIKLNAGFTRIARQFKSLAKVASTGNYNDLTNKPNLSASGISGSYNDLTDKPEIATQEEAQTGTNNTALMTPLRVKEAIETLVSTPDSVTFNTLSAWTEDPVEVFESFYNPTVTPDPEPEEPVETQSIELPEVGITGI
jgi:hypothetical protein